MLFANIKEARGQVDRQGETQAFQILSFSSHVKVAAIWSVVWYTETDI
jgi:hypothetical protein